LVEAAAIVRGASMARSSLSPRENPLDVLAQQMWRWWR
jgi:hypothetical protein